MANDPSTPGSPLPADRLDSLFANHPRSWQQNLYVYPVISRRSGGLSIGVNLNPDKACNFNCVYCQVDRTVPPVVRKLDLERLSLELDTMVRLVLSGELFAEGPLACTPPSHRALRDIAFSGDGEPTTSPRFLDAVRLTAELRDRHGLDHTRLVLITDAAYLDRPMVREALTVLDANNGEIWAKLDAGTETHFQLVNRPNVSLEKVIENITEAARLRPIVIQSMWMNMNGQPPPHDEVDAFAARLNQIITHGGRLQMVQIYTIARQTAESYVTPLEDDHLRHLADRVRAIVAVPVSIYS
ncbi:MAG: radical SAM protein [Phycisphaerae bacterium]|nr:radical SAM protein [Phycisphaerae bacterium]